MTKRIYKLRVSIILPLSGLMGGNPDRENAKLQEENSKMQESFVKYIPAAVR